MLIRRWMAITWPAFLAACVLQAVVFSLVDPLELLHGWSRQAVYAAGFLVFWGAAILSSALTALLDPPRDEAGMREIRWVPPTNLSPENAAARLAGLLDSAMDAIVSVDEEQKIVLYNRAAERIFGRSAAEMKGRSLGMLLPERFRQGHGAQVRHFGQTGVTSRRMGDRTVVYGLRANGEEFPMDASISQLDTPEGKIYTVIVRDVTERVQAQQDLAAFAAEASSVREQEKTRIARELHDELAQSLTALKMDTIWLRDHLRDEPEAASAKLAQMLALIDGSVASTRRIAADLRPLLLDDLGLAPAIEWLVQNFSERTGVPCALDLDEQLELHEPYATAVFRMVQESLANIGKHAQASQARVRVAREEGVIALRVEDDGVGFRPAQPRKQQSLGLVGLRERAHLLRGSLQVESAPGQGTRVEARIPVREEGEAP